MTTPKTRGVEVAPGCWVLPNEVVACCAAEGDSLAGLLNREQPARILLSLRSGRDLVMNTDASAAEVAAKLWPVEVGKRTADQVRHQVSLTLERLVLDREQGLISPADVMSVIRKMQTSLQDEVIHGEQS